jgi:2-amino-4-hydroxy-6-hydroxymethyldihydropteridine diphosphokinase
MTLCYLGLGSNLDSPERQLRRAIAALGKLPYSYVIKVASFYHSQALGRKAQPDYCNTVVALHTLLCPEQLLFYCQKIERQQGRIRKIRWGARTLDIDILLFGSQKINTLKLKVPHPRLKQRDFVLVPLREIYQRLNYT